jgi:hypothetical protein
MLLHLYFGVSVMSEKRDERLNDSFIGRVGEDYLKHTTKQGDIYGIV